MSDSDEVREGLTPKRARTASPNPTVAPRICKTSNIFISCTRALFFHLEQVKKNCNASNVWWHLLKVVHLGDDEPVNIQCTEECDVMMPSINSEAHGRSLFIQVAAKKYGSQCVTTYDEARTNSKGHVKTFLKHANIAGMRQEDFNVSFAICPSFVVLGDALRVAPLGFRRLNLHIRQADTPA